MVSTIVVPLDGTANGDRALRPALDLAHGFHASVTLFRAAGDDREEAVRYLADRVGGLGECAAAPIVHDGFESCGLVHELSVMSDAAVCMVSDFGAAGDDVLGPVAEDVIDSGQAPVLLLGPAQRVHPGRGPHVALVCADGSAAASSIEAVVVDWAKPLQLDAQVLAVLATGEPHLAGIPVERVLREVHSLAFRLERQGLCVTTAILEDGHDPARAILRHVEHHPVGLVATSARGHRHVLHTVLGNTVQDLISRAKVPILIDQPIPCPTHG